ncbi:MAG: sodium-dependent transporter [Christensenella sp.]|nr:sodium-dependent transporter [Christensenella sp.]
MSKRETWGSRSNFIFAAIGSAVGLGNAWRFAGQVYQNGGGAFLLPYIIAIFAIGIPVLMMELAIGKKYKLGAPSAMAAMNPKFEWIGWAGVIIAFIVAAYYSTLVAWVVDYIVASFTMAWGGDPVSFFNNTILHLSNSPGNLQGFSLPVLIGLIVTWVVVILCMRRGIEKMAKIVKWIVIIPVIILVIMCFQAVNMPGASEGIRYYITPDWSALGNFDVWRAAFGQVAYSMSILFALMITYGSFLNKNSDIPKDSLVIGLADMGISLLAGFVVFSTLGYLSFESGVPIDGLNFQGVKLAFITYPQALSVFPGGQMVGIIFSLLFFIMLFALAIDSLFSIVQTVSTAFSDKFKIRPKKALYITCVACFALALLFVTNAGLYWLDIVDHFVNEGNLLFMGIFETIAVCWFFGIPKLRKFINSSTSIKLGKWWDVLLKYICPVVFIVLAASFLVSNILTPYGGYEQQYLFIGGWVLVIATFAIALLLPKLTSKKGGSNLTKGSEKSA